LTERLHGALRPDAPGFRYHELASIFYAALLDVETHDAIDLHGSPRAKRFDLNQPLPEQFEPYDFVINGGTSEHVFDVCQFFRTTHQLTKAGGMMIHVTPFHGWFDHGFYNFQPTFFYDLAAANGYRIVVMTYTEISPTKMVQLKNREDWLRLVAEGSIGRNATICTLLQKTGDEAFRVPMQGYYAESLTPQATQAWKTLRGNS
jgi:hypothetical protein